MVLADDAGRFASRDSSQGDEMIFTSPSERKFGPSRCTLKVTYSVLILQVVTIMFGGTVHDRTLNDWTD